MTIDKAHCMFEQSGTFKNQFKSLGIPAEDYDIQNNFGETDHHIDLFRQIENGYDGKPSVFDDIGKQDLIMAFFPCTHFTGSSNPLFYNLHASQLNGLSIKDKFDAVIHRSRDRQYLYEMLYRLCGIVSIKGLRMVIENPWSTQHYLCNNFIKPPSIIDKDRSIRGDYFTKPTGFWFLNCEPTHGCTSMKNRQKKTIRGIYGRTDHSGLCSEERSMISPTYAKNFICDFLIGKPNGAHYQQMDIVGLYAEDAK